MAVNTPQTTGVFSNAWYGDPVKVGVLKQRYKTTSTATVPGVLTSTVTIPPRSRLRYLYTRNATAITLATGGTVAGTPDAYAIFHTTSSTLTTTQLGTATGTASSTTHPAAGLIGVCTNTASNSTDYSFKWSDATTTVAAPLAASATQSITANITNTSTNPTYVHIVPVNYTTSATTEQFVMLGTTDYFTFSTSATSAIDVWAYVEYADAVPSI